MWGTMSHLHLIWGVNFACPKLNCCGVISTIHPDLNEAELYSRVRVTFRGGHLPEGKGSRPPDLLRSGEGAGGQNPPDPSPLPGSYSHDLHEHPGT